MWTDVDRNPRTRRALADTAGLWRLPPGERARFVLCTLGLCGATLACYRWAWRSPAALVSAFDDAKRLFADFRSVYRPMAAQVLESQQPTFLFFYSAFFALLCRPLAWIPLEAAVWLWGLFQACVFLLFCLVPAPRLLRLSPPGQAVFIAFCLASIPVLHNFIWGQVSVLVVLGILAAFHAHTGGRSVLAGVLLAFVTAIKYYPIVFTLYFALKRDWRALAAFAAAFILFFAAFPMAFLGPAHWLSLHRQIGGGLAAAGHAVAGDINSQYLGHVIHRLAGNIFIFGIDRLPTAGVSRVLGLCVLGLHVAVAGRLVRRHVPGEAAMAAASFFLTLPFIVDTCWPHYFVYLPFCQALLGRTLWLRAQSRRWWVRLALGGVAGSTILTSTFVFMMLADWRAYSAWGAYFIANALLLPGLYGLAFTATGDAEQKRPLPAANAGKILVG